MAGRVPGLSALRKGPARRPGTGAPGGCSGVSRTHFWFASAPGRPPEGTATRGGEAHSTHRTNAGGQRDARGGHRRVRRPWHRRTVQERSPLVPTRPPIGQVLTGGAAATDHGAPRGASESPPGVAADRPRSCDQLVERGGKRPRSGKGWNVTEDLTTPDRRRSLTTVPGSLFGPSSFQRPLLTYSPGSNRTEFREKMFMSKFVLPTGIS